MRLVEKHCVPCEGGVPPLSRESAGGLLKQTPGWKLAKDGLSIKRDFKFKDFKSALDFVDKVGALAEAEGHHPDIELGWGRVKVTTFTHAVGGLSENDFILAAKINKL